METLTPELKTQPVVAETLPVPAELKELLVAELTPFVPDVVRPYEFSDAPNLGKVEIYTEEASKFDGQSPSGKQKIQRLFLNETSGNRAAASWWAETEKSLVRSGVVPEEARKAITLRRAHEFTVLTPEGPAGFYEVMECGDSEEAQITEDEMAAIVKTLEVIDQFTGGALVNSPNRRRIITAAVNIPHPQNRAEGVAGVAYQNGTLLNLREIRRLAGEYQLEVGVMLGVVLVHEQLGHQLERFAKNGTGKVFPEHFDYSEEKVAGKFFHKIHKSITPRDKANTESKPVREYGYVNPAEDFATSVDAAISEAMGWDYETANERSSSIPDRHRSDIIMGLMDDVAKAAKKKYGQGTGFVGSPVSYVEGPSGPEATPGRTLAHSTKPTERVIEEEVARLSKPFKGLPELVYKVSLPEY